MRLDSTTYCGAAEKKDTLKAAQMQRSSEGKAQKSANPEATRKSRALGAPFCRRESPRAHHRPGRALWALGSSSLRDQGPKLSCPKGSLEIAASHGEGHVSKGTRMPAFSGAGPRGLSGRSGGWDSQIPGCHKDTPHEKESYTAGVPENRPFACLPATRTRSLIENLSYDNTKELRLTTAAIAAAGANRHSSCFSALLLC